MAAANTFGGLVPLMKEKYPKQHQVGNLTPSPAPAMPNSPSPQMSALGQMGSAPQPPGYQPLAAKVPNENFISHNPYRDTNINRIEHFKRLFAAKKV